MSRSRKGKSKRKGSPTVAANAEPQCKTCFFNVGRCGKNVHAFPSAYKCRSYTEEVSKKQLPALVSVPTSKKKGKAEAAATAAPAVNEIFYSHFED